MATTDKKRIESFLTRGVENVFPSKAAFKKLLENGKKLRVYFGIDPTGPNLHLGHLIPMRKFAELQKMGHKVILLIGDFTAMIGDPTDKTATRRRLTRKEVLANCKAYKKQASAVLDFGGRNPVELKFNSEWLDKLSFGDVVELASNFTVQQMAERDMFDRRLKTGKPVYLHEFMYPLMQGFDSVAMNVDAEIGGNDQTFNMLAGRDLMKSFKGKEKFVLATKLLVDPTGKKMGKTEGNMVTLADSAEEMFGKVMSWTDGMIIPGFELCTDVSEEDIAKISTAMKRGENPVTYKRWLAEAIVRGLKGDRAAESAVKRFDQVHKAHAMPEDMEEVPVGKGMAVVDALVAAKLVASKSEARRQVEQGGVRFEGDVIRDPNAVVSPPGVLQKGKRHFVRLVR